MDSDVVFVGSQETEHRGLVQCPVCACPIEGSPRECPVCSTPHHDECWHYTGGCAIFGCSGGAISTRRPRRAASNSSDLVSSDASVPVVSTNEIQRRVAVWSHMYRLHWATFAGIGLSLGGSVVLGSALAMMIAVLPLLGSFVPGILVHNLSILSLTVSGTLFMTGLLSIAAYILLLLPALVVLRNLEHLLGHKLSVPRQATRSVLDRLDMPWFGRSVASSFSALSRSTTVLAVLSFAAGLASLLGVPVGSSDWFLAGIGFLAFRVVFCAPFNYATKVRLSHLVMTQNRLTASLKDG